MIFSVARHELLMDFSKVETGKNKPSDVDMFFIGRNFVILGEIKHYTGVFTEAQRSLYEQLAASMVYKDVLILYINHEQRVEDGAERVDIGSCFVSEFYFKPKYEKGKKVEPNWKKAPPITTVNDIVKGFIEKENRKV